MTKLEDLSLDTQFTPSPGNRRVFLKTALLSLATVCLPSLALSATRQTCPPNRRLAFYNLHTGESLDVCFFDDGRYLASSLNEINYILRDFRTNDIKPIDVGLLNLLHVLSRQIGSHEPFHVISGYRSPKTNAMLHNRSSGVAVKSFHLKGKAIDIRMPGIKTSALRRAAMQLNGGGVGYYPRSDFVHVDTGPVRHW